MTDKRTEKRTETHACDYISILSELRSQYNCFDEAEQPYYRTLSEAIKVLSIQPDVPDIYAGNIENKTGADVQKMQDLEQAEIQKAYELGKLDAMDEMLHWIPCSERLPEHSERYLVSVLDGIDRRTTVAPYLPRSRTWSLTGRMAYWKVIAWMPLPEPYQEGRADKC